MAPYTPYPLLYIPLNYSNKECVSNIHNHIHRLEDEVYEHNYNQNNTNANYYQNNHDHQTYKEMHKCVIDTEMAIDNPATMRAYNNRKLKV